MDAVSIAAVMAFGACVGILAFCGFLVWWLNDQVGG